MKRKYLIGLFICLISLQIAIPISMIVKREDTLKNGISFKFKVVPIDPYDAFRGRYVALRVELTDTSYPHTMILEKEQKVFAQLSSDENGFAKISQISLKKPKDSVYLIATVGYFTIDSGSIVHLVLPMDRYYMQENLAPRAEKLYREHNNWFSRKGDVYITVKIKNAFVVIDGLYIGNQRIEDILKQQK